MVTLDPSSSWDDINAVVAEEEGIHGPLTAIANDGSSTLLTFDNTPAKPATNALVAAQSAGKPIIPAGAKLICVGSVFALGLLTLAAATRA
jgi:ABC-type uncharacterized transport system substrate-binding protein